MEHEQTETRERDETAYAWDVFQSWTGSQDVKRFRAAYLGHYKDRDAFGQELLTGFGVQGRVKKLPEWLQAYIRFDGAAVVADFEQAGHFYVYDAPYDGGTYVFDSYG